jgi:hypothetical protein
VAEIEETVVGQTSLQFLVVWGALYTLLGRCSIIESCLQTFFCSYFGHRVLFFAQKGLDQDPPILSFQSLLGGQALVTTSSFFSIEMGSHGHLCTPPSPTATQAGLEQRASQSQPPAKFEITGQKIFYVRLKWPLCEAVA